MTTKLGADAAPSAVTTSEAEVGGEVDHRQMVTDALLDRNAPPAAAAKQVCRWKGQNRMCNAIHLGRHGCLVGVEVHRLTKPGRGPGCTLNRRTLEYTRVEPPGAVQHPMGILTQLLGVSHSFHKQPKRPLTENMSSTLYTMGLTTSVSSLKS
jgi:hypothetical protein